MNEPILLPARRKPLFGSPCNHCGLCCQRVVCEAAKMINPLATAPCAHLRWKDGNALCGLVLAEQALGGTPLVSTYLGIGVGCSMTEPTTQDSELAAYDAKHRTQYAHVIDAL